MAEHRLSDAILRGGFKVDPRKVERVLLEHPDVLEAAVVGIPDDRLGAVPAAVVVLRPDVPARATPDQLIAWTRDRAAPYEVPTRITIAAELPRTVSQKISRDGVVALVTAP